MRAALIGIAVFMALPACLVAHAQDRIAAVGASASGQTDGSEPAMQMPAEAGAVAKFGSGAATGGVLPLSLALALAKDMALPPLPPPITLTLKVDLSGQRVTVTERGKVKHVWAISSGREGYATQTGTFQPQWSSKMWYSRQWDMAPMPHAVFFNRGTAFHATNAVGSLGRPASHGCIRLSPGNAAQLYAMVHRHGMASTKVVVHGMPREQAIARRNGKRLYEQAGPRQRGYQGGYQASYASYGPQTRPSQRAGRRQNPSGWGF